MSRAVTIAEWFTKEPCPPILSTPTVIMGGPRLLGEFVDYLARSCTGGQLLIAVPFVGKNVCNVMPGWLSARHALIDVTIVTKTATAAESLCDTLGVFPWRSFNVAIVESLHAKVYTFLDASGHAVCLVGSHNLSASGALRNSEAGLLFVDTRRGDVFPIIAGWGNMIASLAHKTTWFTQDAALRN